MVTRFLALLHWTPLTLIMPRSNAAKQWKPNAAEQGMIDKFARFIAVAEVAAQHLRSLDFPDLEQVWARVQADFQSDPVKYPSQMASNNDAQGRKEFRMKYEAICFPGPERLPRSPEE
jgi:hypothetical protein